MALFDDITKKAAKFTETAIDKTKDFASTTELKLKKKNVQTDLDEVYSELGKYYYNLLKDEESINDEEKTMKDKIEELLASIKKLDEQIAAIAEDEE